jgi:hypothetical protein
MVTLELSFDAAEFEQLADEIIGRIRELGDEESERRLGCALDEVLDESRGPLFDIVPSENGVTLYVLPSQCFDEIRAALGCTSVT